MPVSTHWHHEPYVFYITLSGALSPDDLETAVLTAQQALTANPDGVMHTITDASAVTAFPDIKTIMQSTKPLMGNTAPGWALVVGGVNPVIQFIVSVLGQTFGFRFRVFGTLPEALDFLSHIDDRLQLEAPLQADAPKD